MGIDDWIPFGGGIRRCLGAPFALAEMTTVIGAVLRCVELEAAFPRPEAPSMHHSTFVPKRGCEVIATSRAGFAS